MQRHTHRARTVIGVMGVIVTWVVVWLAGWAIAPAALGWKPVVITSNSMRPALSTGDIIVARPHPGTDLGPGSVVVFDPGDGRGLVTHRIVAVTPTGSYITQGDANTVRDSTPLHPDQIVGVGTLRVPLIGLPIVWLHAGEWAKLAAFVLTLGAAARLARANMRRAREDLTTPPKDPQEIADGLLAQLLDEEDAGPPQEDPSPVPASAGFTVGALLVALAVITFTVTRAAFADGTAAAGNQVDASWQLLYDVAVTDVRAPETARTNQTVCIEVDVANLGSAAATFVVEVNDIARTKVVGSETVTNLASGDGITLGFSWSPGGPPGTAIIQAEAVFAPDQDPSNNVDSTTMTVTAGGGGGGGGC